MARHPFHDHLLAALGNPRLLPAAVTKLLRRHWRSVGNAQGTPNRKPPDDAPLDMGRLVMALADEMPVLRLQDGGASFQWIGLPDTGFVQALADLADAAPDVRLEPLSGGAPLTRDAALSLGAFVAAFGTSRRIVVERYEKRGARHWVSVNMANHLARALYDDFLEHPRIHEVGDILGGLTLEQSRDALPVDVVCTWVNHADPDWQAALAAHRGNYDGNTDGAAATRFHNNDELRFMLRSIARYMPWVRQIHIVTNCAPPTWLATDHPTVVWVDHAQILDLGYLPTFNSHAIEFALHHIPGLREHFIYFNDDMFACRSLEKARFLAPGGGTRAFLEPYAMVTGPVAEGDPDYLNAARISAGLLRDAFGFVPVRLHRHVPYVLRKSVLDEIEARFPEDVARTRANRFRAIGDINLTSFLYHYFACFHGLARDADIDGVLVRCTDLRWRSQLTEIRRTGCDILCLNEGGIRPPGTDWRRVTRRLLEDTFPDPAPWENA